MDRRREIWLLLLTFAILAVGHWVVLQSALPAWRILLRGQLWRIFLPPAFIAVAWLLLSGALTARRCRETLLLPVTALLVGVGLLFLLRLAGGTYLLGISADNSHLKHNGIIFFGLYHRQLISFAVAWIVLTGVVIFVRDYRELSRYKYLIATAVVGLLLITTIFGRAVEGHMINLRLGALEFQPHEVVKLLLVIFLAAYLVEKKELLTAATGRFGLLTLMDLRYMGPLIILLLLVLALVFKHSDLGAALLLYGVLLGMLYLGTERKSYVFIGSGLFLIGMVIAYHHIYRVRDRVAIWWDPWAHINHSGYQICQALMALGNGRVIGAGLGGGQSELIPAIHTDMIYAAISEDLGLLGAVCLVGLYLVLIGRMFRVALLARDRFGQLLAAGLATSLAIQTWVIMGGATKLIPLTGITLPFISFGGTSLVVNMLLLGLVLKVAEGEKKSEE